MFFCPPSTRMFDSAPTITYNAASVTSDSVDRTTYTFNSVAFGTEHPNREIFIVGYSGEDVPPSSITIGGVTAVVDSIIHEGIGGNMACSFCAHASIPTGTTGTVVVNWPLTASLTIISSFRVINRQSINAGPVTTDEFSGASNASGPNSLTLDCPKNGFAICTNLLFFDFSMTWTGNVTEVFDSSEIGGTARFSAALSTIQTANASLTGTVDWNNNAESRTAMWIYK